MKLSCQFLVFFDSKKNEVCAIKLYLDREYCDWGDWEAFVIFKKWKKNVRTTEGRDPGSGVSILG